MYIHELKKWPNFIWDQDSISVQLIELRHQQGRLIGGMESIGFQLREEKSLIGYWMALKGNSLLRNGQK